MADLLLGVAKSLVEGTLNKAQSAIEEESKLRQSAQRDLVFIAGEFQMMKSFLNVTTEEHVRNNVVSTWVTQVRDLAYDVEDCIEFVIHLDTKSDWWRRLIRCCNCNALALPLDEALDNIEQLKARVQDVSQRNARYNLIGDSGPNPITQLKQLTASSVAFDKFVEARDVTRKQDDLEVITQLIAKKGNGLQVISVWARGVELETAFIIRKVYDDPKISGNFSCRAWVKLMHPFKPDDFIHSLLAQFYANSLEDQTGAIRGINVLKKIKAGTAGEYDLIQEFVQHLNNEKYLIVLDGLSTMVEWDAIRTYLPDRRNGSRIIVSTQHFEIASFCAGHPYLQQFSDDRSLVFCMEGFQGDGNRISETEIFNIRRDKTLAEMVHFPLVGREPQIDELQKYLVKTRFKALQVMSVWGIAGVGKSTLVRSLYYYRMLDNSQLFNKYGWVDISRPFNIRDFSRNLLLEFQSDPLRANEDPIKECKKYLKNHRCLVVIDYLQSAEEWDLIQSALVSRPSGSVIIVITTNASIALHCADKEELVFNVKCLEDCAAFDIFKKEVSRKNPESPLNNIDDDPTLRELVLKCGGLPKVIVAIADLLAMETVTWMDTASYLNARFMHDLETNREFASLNGLFESIRLYFRSCPDILRPCIFYLSIFPGYQSIRRRRLVMRWIAEGYSNDGDHYTAEETGEELFSKLVELSMIVQSPPRTTITYMRMVLCQVSAFFHEYIISRPVEENITFALEVFTLKGSCRHTTRRRGKHLIIEESWDRDRIVFESIDFSRLRSLTVFGKWKPFFISKNMKVLRVLDLENASGVTDKDLEKMLKLLPRLKFLSLRGCREINYLPSSVGDLRQLQILDVRFTSITWMPASFTKLKKLQYVRAGTTMPPEDPSKHCTLLSKLSDFCRYLQLVGVAVTSGVQKLTMLHTLGVVNVGTSGGKAILKELKNLTQLRKLGVSGVSKKNGKDFCSAISSYSHLESLSVWLNKDAQDCINGMSPDTPPPPKLQSLKLYGILGALPAWINQLYNLRKLNLEISTLSEADVKVLGGLKELCILRLRVNAQRDGMLNFCVLMDGVEDRCYEMIKVLEIASRSTLHINFGSVAMQNLELLRAGCCSNGAVLRFDGLKHLSKLKEARVIGSNDEILRKQLEDQFVEHTSKPSLKLEEVVLPALADRNDQQYLFPFYCTTRSSQATQPSCQ